MDQIFGGEMPKIGRSRRKLSVIFKYAIGHQEAENIMLNPIEPFKAVFRGRVSLIQLTLVWAIYNDLSRGHPKWWFSKGIPPKMALNQIKDL